ncbi:signal recognition particle protein [Ruminococcus sp.]|uniref:signal recognition particle protein n=1 Tax=Ruminococcus sp. TaxID=41978 RepID=UPI0025FF7235|nr:signal recognition particle protein [Ruminococcus sp.]MBQ9543425.1 signal recognition particle protein [Ruminococcus sp.]
MAFEGLSEKLGSVFKKLKGRGKLTEADVREAMKEVKMALLEADVSYKVVKDFVANVTERSVGEDVLKSLTPGQQVIKIVNDELVKLMGEANSKINFPSKPPCVIMMCGLQGSGKTTHAAKLAKMFKRQGNRPLLIAADVYRPAAIDQLKIVAEKADVTVFEMGQIDPRKIVKQGLKQAKDYGNDLVIIDTAGRLHIDEELMDELKDIKKIAEPSEIMLVVDAMIGQDAVKVASSFDEALGIDSVILTKLDSDTRGGAALSVLAVTGKPIKFVGMGEKLDEFEPFHPERMASRILGMGDMLTLIEKATQTVDEEEAEKLAKKLQSEGFDLNDLLEQMKQIQKMGSVKSIIQMLPGANKITDEDLESGEAALRKTEAMINSMTKAERARPQIIDPKRKRRIAAGSGTQVSDVNQLLKQYDAMKKMMKEMGIGGGLLHGKSARRKRAALMRGLGAGKPKQ